MFIRRNEWENKCDTNRALLKDKEEKLEIIDMLTQQNVSYEKQIIRLQEELKHKDDIIKIQRERIETGNKDYNILMTANQKLTEWVNKIINEVGIYEVNDRRSVTIPIMKSPRAMAGKWNDIKDAMPEFLSQEEIIIPEIRFVRMK